MTETELIVARRWAKVFAALLAEGNDDAIYIAQQMGLSHLPGFTYTGGAS